MVIIETFERSGAPRYRPTVPVRIDTSWPPSPDHHARTLLTPACCQSAARPLGQ